MQEPTKQVTSIDPVVFTIINGRLHILLQKRTAEPFKGMYAIPGGVVDSNLDNNLDEAVKRVLLSKTNVKINYTEQLLTIGGKDIDPRGWTISISYIALINYQENISNSAKWIDCDLLDSIELGFEHHYEIIKKAMERLKNKVSYSTLPVYLMEDEFTLPDLQKVYEIILNEKLDKSSFRRKVVDTNYLVDTGKYIKKGANRPSALYRVKEDFLYKFRRNMV